ncbi:MAG TPA: FGGY-family carbohydrate kinase, partial [Micavibrio sp.]
HITPEIIRADGGLVNNQFVCQFIADMLDTPLDIPEVTETTALGAAYLAGLHAGVYQGLDDITARWHAARRYTPAMAAPTRQQLYQGWKSAIESVIHHANAGV